MLWKNPPWRVFGIKAMEVAHPEPRGRSDGFFDGDALGNLLGTGKYRRRRGTSTNLCACAKLLFVFSANGRSWFARVCLQIPFQRGLTFEDVSLTRCLTTLFGFASLGLLVCLRSKLKATVASCTMIGILALMLCLSAVALVQRHALGSQQPWLMLCEGGMANLPV